MGVLKAKDLGGNWVPIGIGAGQADTEVGTYTPTLTNIASPSLNNAWYSFVGGPNDGDTGLLFCNGQITMGTLSGGPTITIPPQFRWHGFVSGHMQLGQASLDDVSSVTYVGVVRQWSSSTILISQQNVGAQTYPYLVTVSATTPFTWVAGDHIYWFAQGPVYRV